MNNQEMQTGWQAENEESVSSCSYCGSNIPGKMSLCPACGAPATAKGENNLPPQQPVPDDSLRRTPAFPEELPNLDVESAKFPFF